jgi:hypothetical protein
VHVNLKKINTCLLAVACLALYIQRSSLLWLIYLRNRRQKTSRKNRGWLDFGVVR